MATARRLYLYGVATAALALLATGLGTLLSLALSKLGPPQVVSPDVYYFGTPDSDTISRGIALVMVGLPLWLIHWVTIERSVREPSGMTERRSVVRAVFFGLVLAILLVTAAYSTATIIGTALADAFTPRPSRVSEDLSGPAAWATIGWAFFAYHWFVRRRDVESGGLERWSASLMRLSLYGTAFAAAMIALESASQILHVAWAAVTTVAGLGHGSLPWGYTNAGDAAIRGLILSGSMGVVWAIAWAAHFWYAGTRLLTADAVPAIALGEPPTTAAVRTERRSRLRVAYLAAFALPGVVSVVAAAVTAMQVLLGWAFAVPDTSGSWGRGPAVIDALLLSVPFAVAWWWHFGRAHLEADDVPATSPDARRVGRYLVALVGISFAAIGMANLLSVVLDRALGSGVVASSFQTDPWRSDVAAATSQAAVGLAVSLLSWLAARAQLLASPATAVAERLSTARRWYLYLVCGTSVLAAVAGLAVLIYQFTRAILGEGVVLGAAISQPLSAVLVGGGVVLVHGLALRADTASAGQNLAALPALEAESVPAPAAEPASSRVPAPTVVPAPTAAPAFGPRVLVISGPAEADLDALRVALARDIPEGFTMKIEPAGP